MLINGADNPASTNPIAVNTILFGILSFSLGPIKNTAIAWNIKAIIISLIGLTLFITL